MYDSYGSPTTLNPDWSLDADGTDYVWAYLHQGGRHDASLKLSHFRHRDLHVELGRWTRQDPLGFVDGSSMYQAYVSSPIGFVDPLGLMGKPGNNPPSYLDGVKDADQAREILRQKFPNDLQKQKEDLRQWEKANKLRNKQKGGRGKDRMRSGHPAFVIFEVARIVITKVAEEFDDVSDDIEDAEAENARLAREIKEIRRKQREQREHDEREREGTKPSEENSSEGTPFTL